MKHTHLLYQNDGSVVIYPAYRPAFVQDLHRHIPGTTNKTWRKPSQSWLIAPSHAEIALDLFKKHFPSGEVFIPRSIGGAA